MNIPFSRCCELTASELVMLAKHTSVLSVVNSVRMECVTTNSPQQTGNGKCVLFKHRAGKLYANRQDEILRFKEAARLRNAGG